MCKWNIFNIFEASAVKNTWLNWEPIFCKFGVEKWAQGGILISKFALVVAVFICEISRVIVIFENIQNCWFGVFDLMKYF